MAGVCGVTMTEDAVRAIPNIYQGEMGEMDELQAETDAQQVGQSSRPYVPPSDEQYRWMMMALFGVKEERDDED